MKGLEPDRRVWILNFGWIGKTGWMTTDPWWAARAEPVVETPAVGIYVAPAEKLKQP
jgi:hypothetical protein